VSVYECMQVSLLSLSLFVSVSEGEYMDTWVDAQQGYGMLALGPLGAI